MANQTDSSKRFTIQHVKNHKWLQKHPDMLPNRLYKPFPSEQINEVCSCIRISVGLYDQRLLPIEVWENKLLRLSQGIHFTDALK